MIQSFLILLPVFTVIAVGYGVRRTGFIRDEHWSGIDRVSYYILFPAIIFREIAAADFTGVPVFSMATAIALALITMFALLLISRTHLMRQLDIDGPQYSSVFQGASRFHTFIMLAIVPAYFGQPALALGGLAVATMIPLLNIVNVIVISMNVAGTQFNIRAAAISILSNPFVLSSLAGVLWQAVGLPLPALGIEVLDMIGKGALGVALLTAGAGLRIEQALTTKKAVLFATGLKLLVMPLFMAFWLMVLGVSGLPAAVAILGASVPTGSAAYILAKQLGGDAPMVASILTLQIICAAVTIPMMLSLLT